MTVQSFFYNTVRDACSLSATRACGICFLIVFRKHVHEGLLSCLYRKSFQMKSTPMHDCHSRHDALHLSFVCVSNAFECTNTCEPQAAVVCLGGGASIHAG